MFDPGRTRSRNEYHTWLKGPISRPVPPRRPAMSKHRRRIRRQPASQETIRCKTLGYRACAWVWCKKPKRYLWKYEVLHCDMCVYVRVLLCMTARAYLFMYLGSVQMYRRIKAGSHERLIVRLTTNSLESKYIFRCDE